MAQSGPKVLVIEDEPSQIEILSYNLTAAGFTPLIARTGDQGLLRAKEAGPDLIVLDWMLPGVSGIEVCRQLRAHKDTREIPIIMLSARSEEQDRIRGLETGADDYLGKPYSVAELLVRIKALLRRARPSVAGEELSHGALVLNPANHVATLNGIDLRLGPTEFRLLAVFLEQPSRVFSRDQLLDRVWGRDIAFDSRTVDVHVGRLRKALRQEGEQDLIRTVRGSGYGLT